MEFLPIKRAIISVTNKNGIVDFAAYLASHNVELVSTGGTFKLLEEKKLPVIQVSDVTGFPEILNGRVKTLHPKIHAGILANKDDPFHMETLADKDIKPFDLVCVNLYDFSDAVERNLSLNDAIEEIDIGGPCLLRAAAKNFNSILVAPDPLWYGAIAKELENNNFSVGLEFRQLMASRVFDITSRYDALICSYLRP